MRSVGIISKTKLTAGDLSVDSKGDLSVDSMIGNLSKLQLRPDRVYARHGLHLVWGVYRTDDLQSTRLAFTDSADFGHCWILLSCLLALLHEKVCGLLIMNWVKIYHHNICV